MNAREFGLTMQKISEKLYNVFTSSIIYLYSGVRQGLGARGNRLRKGYGSRQRKEREGAGGSSTTGGGSFDPPVSPPPRICNLYSVFVTKRQMVMDLEKLRGLSAWFGKTVSTLDNSSLRP